MLHCALRLCSFHAGQQHAGYAALLEQVVPDLGIRKRSRRGGLIVLEEAFLGVELFGHPYAPDRLLDGTERHPASKGIVKSAAVHCGAAAAEGAKCKEKHYPPRAGMSVIPCTLESTKRSRAIMMMTTLKRILMKTTAKRTRNRQSC